ncbi:MAG: chromosome condensation regulator, partial [Clostridia bacterium]|nr:chromosome condensation regulator [Clostridia bacterium]
IGLKKDGSVVAVGDNYTGQIDISHWADIVSVSAGCGYTVGIRTDGTAVEAGNAEKIISELSKIINPAIPAD